jgi:hypothetical protein
MRGWSVGLTSAALVASLAVALTSRAEPAPGDHDRMLSQLIRDAAGGHIQYQTLTPTLANAVRAQAEVAQTELTALGPLRSVTFQKTDASGAELYRTDFERGALEWAFSVNPQGLIANAMYRKPAAGP